VAIGIVSAETGGSGVSSDELSCATSLIFPGVEPAGEVLGDDRFVAGREVSAREISDFKGGAPDNFALAAGFVAAHPAARQAAASPAIDRALMLCPLVIAVNSWVVSSPGNGIRAGIDGALGFKVTVVTDSTIQYRTELVLRFSDFAGFMDKTGERRAGTDSNRIGPRRCIRLPCRDPGT
jgi:hypothetical protein